MSPEEWLAIEVDVDYRLDTLWGLFYIGNFDENNTGNADETHFVFNVEKGRTLWFFRTVDVKYADVVRSGEGFHNAR